MSAPVPLHPAAKPRDRSIAARRAARLCKVERERLIVDYLNRGVSVAEIAGRIGVTEKRIRALTKDILARRMPAAPEDFAALQVSRLNEALLIAYGAMSAENLRAVALVVRIVRELDRYHGFAAAGRRPRRDPGLAKTAANEPLAAGSRPAASQETETGFRPGHDASEQRQAPVPASAEEVVAPAAPLGKRP
jgi:transposase-like protein